MPTVSKNTAKRMRLASGIKVNRDDRLSKPKPRKVKIKVQKVKSKSRGKFAKHPRKEAKKYIVS